MFMITCTIRHYVRHPQLKVLNTPMILRVTECWPRANSAVLILVYILQSCTLIINAPPPRRVFRNSNTDSYWRSRTCSISSTPGMQITHHCSQCTLDYNIYVIGPHALFQCSIQIPDGPHVHLFPSKHHNQAFTVIVHVVEQSHYIAAYNTSWFFFLEFRSLIPSWYLGR